MANVSMGGPDPVSTNANKNMMIIGGIIIIVLLIAAFMLFARTSDRAVVEDDLTDIEQEELLENEADVAVPARTSPTTSPLGSPVAATSPTMAPTGAAGAVKTFSVTGTNFKFDPAEMRVKQGDTVRVTLTNPSTMPHDWRLDEFKAATKVINQGQTDTIEFVADKKGTYEYYCSVGQHRQQGMVGKLIVE